MAEPSLRDLRPSFWISLAAVIVALAIAFHALFPRYDYRVIGEDGRGVIIFDRWTGKFQRADYAPDREPSLGKVVTPF